MHNRTHVVRVLGLLALMACALGLPGLAFADNVIQMPGSSGNTAWTVYAFGNAQAVSTAFRSIYNFTSSTLFKDAIGVIALCGALAVGLAGGFTPGVAKRFIGYCVATFLVTYLFFGWGSGGPVVVQVEVEDTVDGTWVAPVTVPAIVGLPAAVISTAGYQLTQQLEASFPIPDALKLSNGAPFNLAAAMVADSTKARIQDPNLASSMAYYVQDCVIPAIARGNIAASALINSTDFLTDIHVNLPSVYVNTLLSTPVGSPNIVSCNDDWSLINAAVSANGSDAAAYLKDASAWADTPALNVVNAAADTVAQWSTNNGITDGGSMVKQAAVLASFTGAFRQSAAATGNSDFLTALSVSQATDSQKTGWIVGAEIFNRTMGYIFAILQVFVYALTPLILCVVMVPGVGAPLLKSFGQVLLWLAIWQPMLAIVNFIVLIMQQGDLASIMSNGSGAYGMTLSTLGIVSEKSANLRAAATFVGTMVPALAWLFVKGSLDFSRVVGAAVGEHFAQGAANTMTTGNYSLNQASMDSFTANKHSIGHTGDWGYGMVSTGQGGFTNNINQGGGAALEAMGQRAGIQAGGGLGTNANGGVVDSAGRSAGGGDAYSASRGGGLTTASSTGNSAAGTDSTSTGSGVQGSIGDSIQPFRGIGAGQPKNGTPSTMAGGPGGGVPGAPGGVPGQLTDNSLVSRLGGAAAKPVVEALRGVNASVGASMNAGKQHVDANTHSASQTTTGQTTRSGNETKSGQEGYNESTQASSGHGWQHDAGIRVTGIATLADTYAAMRPYRQPFRSAFDHLKHSDGPAPSTTMGQLNQSLDRTDRSAHVTGHERAADDAAQQQLKQRADQNLKEARTQAKAYEGLGSGPAGEVASELDPKNPKSTAARAQAGLGETALPYFKSELKAMGATVVEGAKEGVEKLEDKLLGTKHGEKQPGANESKPAAGSVAALTLQPGMATPAGQALAYAQLTPQVRTPAADSGVAAPAKPGSAPVAPAASTTQAQAPAPAAPTTQVHAPTAPAASTAQAHAPASPATSTAQASAPTAPAASTTQVHSPAAPAVSTQQAHSPAVETTGAAPQVHTPAEPNVSSPQVHTPAMETAGAAPVQAGSGMQLPTLATGKAPARASGATGGSTGGSTGSGASAVESDVERHARDKGPVKDSSGQPEVPQQPVESTLTPQGGTSAPRSSTNK